MLRLLTLFVALAGLCLVPLGAASSATWVSEAVGAPLPSELLAPTAPVLAEAPPLIVYLKNLASRRVGTESDEQILASLRAEGFLVLCLDYQGHPKACFPHLNRDIAALRAQLQRRSLIPGWNLNTSRAFIIPAGHRVAQSLVYAREEGRTLALDLIYPSQPRDPVGTILEFSCDNAQRMGNYSLHVCSDTLLEGLAAEGFAVAMADHPVAAPYKGHDPMPDSARKIKAAVRLLRRETLKHGGNGRIVPVGFSRGSGMALMLVTTAGLPDFDGYGVVEQGDSTVDGAVVLSGRFTYLDLLPNDRMLPRYQQWWGARGENEERWKAHGALDYLNRPTVPLFLSINATEGPDALHQMEVLRNRLSALGSSFRFMQEETPRGHKVPLDPQILEAIRDYLRAQLSSSF